MDGRRLSFVNGWLATERQYLEARKQVRQNKIATLKEPELALINAQIKFQEDLVERIEKENGH